jgi:glycosyltransferase involved in cell wall biosynthesis
MSPTVTLVGRPFHPAGMGQRLRAVFRSLGAAGHEVRVRDIADPGEPSGPEAASDLRARLVERLEGDLTIVMMNAGEQELVATRLASELGQGRRKIVYPAWDLQRHPESWASELEPYDEVWAASSWSGAAFRDAVRRPVAVLPLPCHPALSRSFSRRHLGVSETAYVFVYFLDLASFAERMNPGALLDAVDRLRAARPFAEFQVVVRLGSPGADPATTNRLKAGLEPHRRQVLLVDSPLSSDEVTSLVRVGDAFVSLHRAEDFGFGAGEAMYFGKPVVATGFSGNLDYMTPETALLVGATTVPVPEGQCPHAAGQVWADPDVEHAAAHMIRLLDDPEGGRALGARASAHVRTRFSQRACGLRYAARLAELAR